jgi:drug/metabolite transporter (DMT)-like permease
MDAGAIFLVLLLSALWGGNSVAVKVGLADSPPLALAWMRFVLGGVCVLAWGWKTRAPFRVGPGEGWPLLGLGLLFTTQLGLLNVGTWLSTAGHANVLLNVYPVHIVLLAHFLVPGDRLTWPKVAGVLLGYAGILTLFSHELLAPGSVGPTVLVGDVVLSVGAILLALRQVVLNRQLQFIHPLKPLLSQVVIGIPLFALLSWLFEPAPTRWTGRLAASLFYQGVIIAGFNFIANMRLLKLYRPSSLAAFALATPIFGAIATVVVLGEPVGWTLALATLLVAGGIAVASLFGEAGPADRLHDATAATPALARRASPGASR